MSAPLFSIGGIASGLDTHNIIEELLALERRPIDALARRRLGFEAVDAAWGSIVGKMSNLRSAIDELRDPGWLSNTTAVSSSSTSVATASISGPTDLGRLAFHVDRRADAHQIAVGDVADSPTSLIGAGTITLARADGSSASVELTADATYADAADLIDDLDGYSSRVLKRAEGEYRLLVTSETSGAAASFTVTSDVTSIAGGGVDVLTQGTDAQLSIGTLTVTRSTNSIDDLVQGTTIELHDTGDVTIEIAQDTERAVERVSALVASLNGLLSEMATQSASSIESAERGPLSGDGLVRTLSLRLRGALTRVTGSGEYATLSSVGISLNRDGTVELDDTRLRDALADDPAAVARLVGMAVSASGDGVEIVASERAEPGTYDLEIDVAATVAAITGTSYTPPADGLPQTFRILVPGEDPAEVTLTSAHQTVAQAVSQINTELEAREMTQVRAVVDGDAIRLVADGAGAQGSFTVEDVDSATALGIVGDATGTDASGHLVDGDGRSWELTGLGASLRATDGPVDGLVLQVPTDRTGPAGSVTIRNGFASALDAILREAEGAAGSIAGARRAIEGRIETTNERIEAFEIRIELRERTLRRQFTALETAIGRMNQQGSWLTAQLGALNG